MEKVGKEGVITVAVSRYLYIIVFSFIAYRSKFCMSSFCHVFRHMDISRMLFSNWDEAMSVFFVGWKNFVQRVGGCRGHEARPGIHFPLLYHQREDSESGGYRNQNYLDAYFLTLLLVVFFIRVPFFIMWLCVYPLFSGLSRGKILLELLPIVVLANGAGTGKSRYLAPREEDQQSSINSSSAWARREGKLSLNICAAWFYFLF